MDLELTATQRQLRDAAQEYARGELAPRAERFDREKTIPSSVYAELAARGLMGMCVPGRVGGTGADPVAYSLAMSAISSACASTAVGMSVTNMVGEVIASFGTEAQRARYNPPLCRGALGAFALSEPENGSDAAAMRTRAHRDGDEWVITGNKQWITQGDDAEVLVVWARTGAAGPKGVSAFLVGGDNRGVHVSKTEDKLGLRGSHTCALTLEDARVPADALLGEEGRGFRIAMMALDGGRIGIASQSLGIAESAYEQMRAHAKTLSDIDERQGVHQRIADARTRLDAARLLTLRAASLKAQGHPFSEQAAMAKVFASETAQQVCEDALRTLGDEGARVGSPVERHVRDVRVTSIYEGTSEIQRLVIARSVLQS